MIFQGIVLGQVCCFKTFPIGGGGGGGGGGAKFVQNFSKILSTKFFFFFTLWLFQAFFMRTKMCRFITFKRFIWTKGYFVTFPSFYQVQNLLFNEVSNFFVGPKLISHDFSKFLSGPKFILWLLQVVGFLLFFRTKVYVVTFPRFYQDQSLSFHDISKSSSGPKFVILRLFPIFIRIAIP